jgi:hypothetical protein
VYNRTRTLKDSKFGSGRHDVFYGANRVKKRFIHLVFTAMMLLTGCNWPTPSRASTPIGPLTVSLLYPKQDTQVEMGQAVTFILQVSDARGEAVDEAQISLTVIDPNARVIAEVPVTYGSGEAYRSDSWSVPHRSPQGVWRVKVSVSLDGLSGETSGTFQVAFSTSEYLLNKYGFWLDAPTMRGIVPSLVAEAGDAQDGLIRLGGVLPTQHVFVENWVEVQWRKGDYHLGSPVAVRRFLLDEVGNLGFTPVRQIDPFTSIKFKRWDAWLANARGQFKRYQLQWMVFYAPEVDKTYAIGTTVVLPPTGVDEHAVLRESFDISPQVEAQGVAPVSLSILLPTPELVGPSLGTVFIGLDQPVTLQWKPVKELATDEYYLVAIDYNYDEANIGIGFTTRETQFTLPESLYRTKNCGIFDWQITLMRQTGTDSQGHPIGEPLSYHSLYWYVQWSYPSREARPFPLLCPNAQF